MKYLIRSLKQFVYLAFVLGLILFVLVKANLVEADVSKMFVNGYDSLWQIALIIAVFAGIYPKLGYSSRSVRMYGSDEEIRPILLEVMENHGYRVEKDAEGTVTFIKRAPLSRFAKLWEDRVTFSRTVNGYSVEGITKDIVRIASALEYKLNLPGEDA
ncbi:MAG: hypothetical protein MJY51_03480 [Bacteroidales bacterium]|nr:hypothetical protein [Bacteroidales bacterium]